MNQRIWEQYELTYTSALQYKIENGIGNNAAAETERLRREMKALGTVNLGAIEEYDRINNRYETINKQQDDLLLAKTDLEYIIGEVKQQMEIQFKEQFKLINQYFGETFKELFGGGYAELVLENEESILDCGIEIQAQPPGKKLQQLSLLSGGERALTAIAILFSMLKLKPTPFCVLDEVEAALDEANVGRYADFLRQYSEKTQFVIITHRKGTMEASNALYGVAMEEKGVSRMVSVKLTDAEKIA
jgi:chromosome segregation protein